MEMHSVCADMQSVAEHVQAVQVHPRRRLDNDVFLCGPGRLFSGLISMQLQMLSDAQRRKAGDSPGV